MDETIIGKMADGDETGLLLLKQHYGHMIAYIVSGILPEPEDAEECISDIYWRLWHKIATYDAARGAFSAWLTAVARNAALNYRKRGQPAAAELKEDVAITPGAEEDCLRQERRRQIEQAIRRLSIGERQLFYRKNYYSQPIARIAAELGMTERSVEGKLYRLRKKLRQLLGEDFV